MLKIFSNKLFLRALKNVKTSFKHYNKPGLCTGLVFQCDDLSLYYQMLSDNRTRLHAPSRIYIYITYYYTGATHVLITDIWRFGVEILTLGYSLGLSRASICKINYISYLFHAFTFFLGTTIFYGRLDNIRFKVL